MSISMLSMLEDVSQGHSTVLGSTFGEGESLNQVLCSH